MLIEIFKEIIHDLFSVQCHKQMPGWVLMVSAEPSNQYLVTSCDQAMCKLSAQENRDI